MLINEMHVLFRQYAQQMGQQNVRGILPEQIDILLNTSITDNLDKIVAENIVTSNKGIIDNGHLGNINTLRSLFKKDTVNIAGNQEYIKFKAIDANIGKITGATNFVSKLNSIYKIIDLAVSYRVTKTGYTGTSTYIAPLFDSVPISKMFKIRLFDGAFTDEVFEDYHNRPQIISPVAIIFNNDNIEIYIDKFIKRDNNYYNLKDNLIPYNLQFTYLKKPNKVSLADNISCDLHESTHEYIVKYACDLYKIALSNGLFTSNNSKQ